MKKEEEVITFDLSKFGSREIEETIKLLQALEKTDLDIGEGLKLCFNTHSGYVFLVDDDYRVYMINEETNKLEEWFSCPICGAEGFKEDVINIENHTGDKKECEEWIKETFNI